MNRPMKRTHPKPVKRRVRKSLKHGEVPLTAKELLFWSLICIGRTLSEACDEVGVVNNTGYSWMQKIQDHMGKDADIDKYRTQSARAWPLAFASLLHHLKNKDKIVTVAWLKGHGIFSDNINLTGHITHEKATELRQNNQQIAFKQMGINYIDITPDVIEGDFEGESSQLSQGSSVSVVDDAHKLCKDGGIDDKQTG